MTVGSGAAGKELAVPISVANGPAGPARRPTKYPAGPENVPAGPVKTERSPWQALVGATGYAPSCTTFLIQCTSSMGALH